MSSTFEKENKIDATTREPLYIDTNIEYELDMSRFPGWDDPLKRSEPKLMIHQHEDCPCYKEQEELYSLLDYCSHVSLCCTENDDLTDYTESGDDIIDSLLDDTDDTCSSFGEAHIDPIAVSVTSGMLSSDDSGTDSLFEYLTETYGAGKNKGAKRKLSFDVDDVVDELPFKRSFVDDNVFEVVQTLFQDLDDIISDSEDTFRGS